MGDGGCSEAAAYRRKELIAQLSQPSGMEIAEYARIADHEGISGVQDELGAFLSDQGSTASGTWEAI